MIPLEAPRVVCPEQCVPRVLELNPDLTLVETYEGVVLLHGPAPDTARLREAGLSVVRLLDIHYLIFEPSDVSGRIAAEQTLFDKIADIYEDEIDRENNLHNIRALLGLVVPESDTLSRLTILDYGCGTGLSALVRRSGNVHLLGFDVSARMLEYASKRGLATVTPEQLRSLPEECVDGVIASYVLHLAASHVNLADGIRVLRKGARWSANFHKGQCVAQVDDIMSASQEMISLPPASALSGNHGPYRVWQRV